MAEEQGREVHLARYPARARPSNVPAWPAHSLTCRGSAAAQLDATVAENGLVITELERRRVGGGWKMKAVGKGAKGRRAYDQGFQTEVINMFLPEGTPPRTVPA